MITTLTPLTRRLALWAATVVGSAAMVGGGWSITQTVAATHPPVRVVATSQPGTATAGAPGAASGTNAAASKLAAGPAPTFPQPVHDPERDSGSGY